MFQFRRNNQALLLVFYLTICLVVSSVQAGVSCTSTLDCESKLIAPGVSVCEDGECTNPFERGCLKVMGEKYGKKDFRVSDVFDKIRICNSDDNFIDGNKEWCRRQDFADYFSFDEVRISPSNWESAVIMGWLYQILLTEILDVPVTMEYNETKKGKGSFYDRKNDFVFVTSDFEEDIHKTLWEADKHNGDCSKDKEPCAHVLPEVWSAGIDLKHLGEYLPSYCWMYKRCRRRVLCAIIYRRRKNIFMICTF